MNMLGRVCDLVKCLSSFTCIKDHQKILKSGWRRTEKSQLPSEPIFFIAVGVLPVELIISLPSFNGLCCKLIEIALFL